MTSDQIDHVIDGYLQLGPDGRRSDPRIGSDRQALIMSGAAILQALCVLANRSVGGGSRSARRVTLCADVCKWRLGRRSVLI